MEINISKYNSNTIVNIYNRFEDILNSSFDAKAMSSYGGAFSTGS